MARHRKHRKHYGKHHRGHRKHYGKHHRRRYGAFDLDLKRPAPLSSGVFGAALGLGVGAGLKALISQTPSLQQSLPSVIQNNMMLVGAVLGGGGAYLARKHKDRAVAEGNLVGALAFGVGVTVWEALQENAPSMFSGVVELNLANGAKVKALKGLLVSSPNVPFPPQAGAFNGYGLIGPSPMQFSGYAGTLLPSNPASRGPQVVGMADNYGGTDDQDEEGAP